MAVRSPRWFLTLLALVLPTAFGLCRACDLRDENRPRSTAEADVVFRHYL